MAVMTQVTGITEVARRRSFCCSGQVATSSDCQFCPSSSRVRPLREQPYMTSAKEEVGGPGGGGLATSAVQFTNSLEHQKLLVLGGAPKIYY